MEPHPHSIPTTAPAPTFTSAAAARKLILATDSRLRLRGSRLKPERELEKEQREAAPGVTGVCGVLRPSAVSSAMRKARPRAKGSMIWWRGGDAGVGGWLGHHHMGSCPTQDLAEEHSCCSSHIPMDSRRVVGTTPPKA